MTKGEKQKNYNDFEEEILHIVGYTAEKYCLEFFFEHLYQTFAIAEKSIVKHSNEYKYWVESEDYETRKSIYFTDPQHIINSFPITTTLYNSHFTTIHSELEVVWDDIVSLHNNYFPSRQKISISNSYFTNPTFDPNCILDKTLLNYKILASYNLIRNKIVHGSCKTSSLEYQTVKQQIDNSTIKHIKTTEVGDNAYFQIDSIEFCREYSNKIVWFIRDIADNSFAQRNQGNL